MAHQIYPYFFLFLGIDKIENFATLSRDQFPHGSAFWYIILNLKARTTAGRIKLLTERRKKRSHRSAGRLQDVGAEVLVLYLLSQGHHSLHTVLVLQGQIFVVIKHVLEGHVRVEVLAGPNIVAEASGSSGARSMLGELLAIPSNSATAKKKYSAVPSSSHCTQASSPAEVLVDPRPASYWGFLRPTPTPLAAR